MATGMLGDIELGLTSTRQTPAPGYPLFSELIASHPSFHLCRQFGELRARLLLLKQDRLAELELELRRLDGDETNRLFLASRRSDRNQGRQDLITKIDLAMKDYDLFLARLRAVLAYDSAPPRAVGNLQRWIRGHPCMAREETAYLDQTGDLISISPLDDSTTAWLQAAIGDALVCLGPKRQGQGIYRFRSALFRAGVRTVVALLIASVLLSPVVVCNFVPDLSARLWVVSVATAIFVAILATLTKASTVELVMVGTTFTTVMVVFISTH
ncbi:unnamed protein product [Clonostachys solani]|uniref:DUF6594 domain-containing protein n=1 Tax=Clonostachys solani TaxID=160281 RepID=A0A9N9ZGK9_9HYPO|nr:unnamed protein product [Clonostachys solani]